MAFRQIARLASLLEAEAIGHALDQHDIPFLVKSEAAGVFGPGMVGSSPVGASLWVPENAVDRVRELLSCVVSLEDDNEVPETASQDDSS